MGIKNAMPADLDVFKYYIKTVNRLLPDSLWCGAGIGKNQIVLNEWCIESGGHVRTGLEDNIRLSKEKLAPSNASLVNIAKELCHKYARPVATWQEARDLLEIGNKVG
jgi:3-keto-5-aminohexanoate cleavage enzyme